MKIQLFPTKNVRKGPNVVQNLCTDNYANGSFFFIFSFFASRAMNAIDTLYSAKALHLMLLPLVPLLLWGCGQLRSTYSLTISHI